MFLKLKFKKSEELKVLANLFKSLKLKELKKLRLMFMFKIIKLFKNTIDLTIKNFTVPQDTENMVEFLLTILKEKQKALAVLPAAGLSGDF